MSRLAQYRQSYDYEKDGNQKMLAMLETVPAAGRSDARFQQAVTLAGHLAEEPAFTEANGECFRLPLEVQIVQLIGHASYHRGQVALLVRQLGGETVDTDYADWWWVHGRTVCG